MTVAEAVVAHYGKQGLLERIDAALRESGKDPERLSADDLAGVDEFHSRGREGTVELAEWLPPTLDGELLDIGSGIGGAARFLAAARGYRVVGVDLTPEYVEVANELSRRCGLADRVRFETADALSLPFTPASFAAAYTQHAAMNIADKAGLYAEIARVLRPGGTLVIYDILQGPGGPVRYPTPWSADGSTSFMLDLPALERHLAAAGFAVLEYRDRREQSVQWFEARAAATASGTPPALSIRLLLGPMFAEAFANQAVNMREARTIPTYVRAVRR